MLSAELQVDVGGREAALGKRLVCKSGQRLPGLVIGQPHLRMSREPVRVHEVSGRGIGGTHPSMPVNHEHAVGQVLDDELVHAGLHQGFGGVALGDGLLADQARGELVGQQGDDEQARPGQCGLQEPRCGFDRHLPGHPPGVGEQQDGNRRRRAQGKRECAQYGRQQNRQREQGREADVAPLEELQGGKRDHVDGNGADPLWIEGATRRRCAAEQANGNRGYQVDQ